MVRLKTRYILFQLRYPDFEDTKTAKNVQPKTLISILRASMSKNFGDIGLSETLNAFTIKYFSNSTSVGILRVHCDAVEKVLGAMFFVSSVDGKNVIWDSIGVSGSISKCERRAIQINRRILRDGKNNENVDDVLDIFVNKDIDGL